jgi:hypothetical protein
MKKGSRSSSPKKSAAKVKERLANLEHTLANAENKQLDAFIKTRSRQIDSELASLREKLQAPQSTVTNSLSSTKSIEGLIARGRKIGVDFGSADSFEGAHKNSFDNGKDASVLGRLSAVEPSERDSIHMNYADEGEMPLEVSPNARSTIEERESRLPMTNRGDQMRDLLLRIRKNMEDREREGDTSRGDIRDMLLPPHLMAPGEVSTITVHRVVKYS